MVRGRVGKAETGIGGGQNSEKTGWRYSCRDGGEVGVEFVLFYYSISNNDGKRELKQNI